MHVEDLCNAHIYLFEHPEARGRYICSAHCFEITELARSLSNKYPEYNIPAKYACLLNDYMLYLILMHWLIVSYHLMNFVY